MSPYIHYTPQPGRGSQYQDLIFLAKEMRTTVLKDTHIKGYKGANSSKYSPQIKKMVKAYGEHMAQIRGPVPIMMREQDNTYAVMRYLHDHLTNPDTTES